MIAPEAPTSIPTNQTMKRLVVDHAFRRGVSASEIIRQAIDKSIMANRVNIDDIGKPFLAARLTAGQQKHLRHVAQKVGVSHQTALEAMLCDFLFDGEPSEPEAANEPDLFD